MYCERKFEENKYLHCDSQRRSYGCWKRVLPPIERPKKKKKARARGELNEKEKEREIIYGDRLL